MCTVAAAMLRESTRSRLFARLQTSTRAPIVGLILVSLLSLGARAYKLDEPCQSPCNTANEHTMIFDEAYYVNAARVIVGIHPPQGDHYSASPLGTDPNAEHPQGAKLIVAAAIELFGDGPFAWRLPSLIFGSLALLGMFALVRSAGGGRWSALGAATLMATDNLLLVHGRIFTLDIYVVTMMIWGVAFYLQDRPGLGPARRDRPFHTHGVHQHRSVRGAAGDHGPDRDALRGRRGHAPHRRAVPAHRAHVQLRRSTGEPQRSAGDRVLPVAVAAGSQGDPLPAHQSLATRPGLSRRPSGGGVLGDAQSGDHGPGDPGAPVLPVSPPAPAASRAVSGGPAAGDAGGDVVHRHVGAVRRAQPGRSAHELHLLHGDRDAGDLRRGHLCGGAGLAPGPHLAARTDRRLGVRRPGRRGPHVPLRGGLLSQVAKISSATSSAVRSVRSRTVTPASLRIQVSWRRA